MEFEKSGKNGSVFRVEIVVFAPDTVVGQLVAAAFQHGAAQIHMGEAGLGSNCGKFLELFRRQYSVEGGVPGGKDHAFEIHFSPLFLRGFYMD